MYIIYYKERSLTTQEGTHVLQEEGHENIIPDGEIYEEEKEEKICGLKGTAQETIYRHKIVLQSNILIICKRMN